MRMLNALRKIKTDHWKSFAHQTAYFVVAKCAPVAERCTKQTVHG